MFNCLYQALNKKKKEHPIYSQYKDNLKKVITSHKKLYLN